MAVRGDIALGWAWCCFQHPDLQSYAVLSAHDWQQIADTEVVVFPHFRLTPDMDQSLHVLYCIMS